MGKVQRASKWDVSGGIQPVRVFVPGCPRAKQSFQVVGHGKGIAPPATRAWQSTVAARVKERCNLQGHQMTKDEWYSVKLVFILPGKISPDLDNLTKAILDGCNGIIWQDDQRVQSLVIYKVNLPDRRGDEGGVLIEAKVTHRYNENMLDREMQNGDWPIDDLIRIIT